MALQGVETGNMKAWLAVSVTPRARYRGLMWREVAIVRTTGTSMEVVAALEAICEITEVTRHRRIRIMEAGREPSSSNFDPTNFDINPFTLII